MPHKKSKGRSKSKPKSKSRSRSRSRNRMIGNLNNRENRYTEKRQNNNRARNNARSVNYPSDSEYFTAEENSKRDERTFTAKVFVPNIGLPIPEHCNLFIRGIGYVPVEREIVTLVENSYTKRKELEIPSTWIKHIGLDFQSKHLTFSEIDHTKFVVKVTNDLGQDVGHVVGVLFYSIATIPSIPYLSSKDLHREGLNKAYRYRRTTETSIPAGTHQINMGDPIVEFKLVGLNQPYAEDSGFNGYHLMAICISLLNHFHLPVLPYYRRDKDLALVQGARPLNGLAYPIYVSSVPGAVPFYEKNGFVKVPRNPFTGGPADHRFEQQLILVA